MALTENYIRVRNDIISRSEITFDECNELSSIETCHLIDDLVHDRFRDENWQLIVISEELKITYLHELWPEDISEPLLKWLTLPENFTLKTLQLLAKCDINLAQEAKELFELAKAHPDAYEMTIALFSLKCGDLTEYHQRLLQNLTIDTLTRLYTARVFLGGRYGDCLYKSKDLPDADILILLFYDLGCFCGTGHISFLVRSTYDDFKKIINTELTKDSLTYYKYIVVTKNMQKYYPEAIPPGKKTWYSGVDILLHVCKNDELKMAFLKEKFGSC